MDCYCDVCDYTIKVKSKCKDLKNLTDNELEKCIQRKHTIGKLDFFWYRSKFFRIISPILIKDLFYISLNVILRCF